MVEQPIHLRQSFLAEEDVDKYINSFHNLMKAGRLTKVVKLVNLDGTNKQRKSKIKKGRFNKTK